MVPFVNGCKDFSFVGVARDSDGRAIAIPQNITVKTKFAAADGEEMETPLSIKFRAPRARYHRIEQLLSLIMSTLCLRSILRQHL